MTMRNQRGAGLLEFLVALAVMTVCLLAAVYYVTNATQGTKHNTSREFAIQKAISILEELKAVLESKTGSDATLLDAYDDGTGTDTVLTVQAGVSDPAHPASANLHDGAQWKYERQVSVQRFQSIQSNDVRLVSVRVFGWENGQKMQLAEVSSVIRTIADSYPPSQVYDVYCLAVENVPGWWVYMANLVPFVESAISDLQARNPGLEFRVHWVRKLAYGRNEIYTPYINDASDSNADIDYAYFYPGSMPSGSSVNYYYVPSGIDAQMNVDGTLTNGYDASTNPWPYALADQWNHAMRYPDEKALFDKRVAAGNERADTPTWRMLIEDMHSRPHLYSNALLINVHGELFPFPPLRNFSDAARDPATHPEVRAVTHPEQLRYENDEAVKLRVYSYLTDPDDGSSPEQLSEPITVLVRGLSAAPGLVVTGIEGGLDLDPADGDEDVYIAESFDTFSDHTGDMYYEASIVSEGLLIKLHNSPLVTPCPEGDCDDGGIASGKRLYGMEYIPTPMNLGTGTGDFSRNLAVTGDRTKNTARWVITLPDSDLPDNALLTIETRIGDDLTSGVTYPTANEPANLSRTYAWRGSDTWVFGDGTSTNLPNLPLTERFQIMGDPRHMPYADLKKPFHSTNNPLGMGYNRYFDDFHNGSGNKASDSNYWPDFGGVKNNWSSSDDGWSTGSGYVEVEVNRCFQILRQALLHTHSVYTTMSGFSYYYIGLGGEIGYDSANGFPYSISTSRKPFDGGTGARWEMSITNAQSGGVKYIKSNESGNDWWSINWLGELYPDEEYSTWLSDGNIYSGSGANTYVRVRRDQITTNLPTGTSMFNALRRAKEPGSTTMFSIGSTSSKFHHQYKGGQYGDLIQDGLDIANYYNFPIPTRVEINRPFNINLNGSGIVPNHYQASEYYDGTLSGSAVTHFYDHDTSYLWGSTMIKLDGDSTDAAYVVVNGIAATTRTGSAFLGRWAFLTLIQGYLAGGVSTASDRIPQVPRIAMTQPNDLTDLDNPSSIAVAWTTEWKRWDGRKYTSSYSSSFSETASMKYAVMYSADNGKTWKYAKDDSAAIAGVRPASDSVLETSLSYTWPVPSSKFPKGTYIVRVEGYRDGRSLHYSYHQTRIFIRR